MEKIHNVGFYGKNITGLVKTGSQMGGSFELFDWNYVPLEIASNIISPFTVKYNYILLYLSFQYKIMAN